MATTYTVKKGDTLSEIAEAHKTEIAGNTIWDKVDTLVKLNNIQNRDYIVVGQVLKFSGTADTPVSNNTSKAKITLFGLQSNTDRTVYAAWSWTKTPVKHYEVRWYYDTGDGIWFVGNSSTVEKENKQSTYNAPENAKRVKFKVKPVSESKSANNTDIVYWTALWSTEQIYNFSSNPPSIPPVPTVTIEDLKLTASLSNLDVNGTDIEFQIVKNDLTVFKTGSAKIFTTAASYSCTVSAGSKYKVRCRAYKSNVKKTYGDWSEYSSNVSTQPATPKSIKTCKATSKTSVYLEWYASSAATSYDIEYTTNKQYFDNTDQTTKKTGIEFTHFEVTGLETGEEYFFRVRATNDAGSSSWTSIKSVVIGTDPAAPTTWSSVTTAITGDPLTLYWVHNSADNSSQTFAELELSINGTIKTHTIENTSTEEDEDENVTSSYVFDTSGYVEGSKIQWRVRTAGITKVYGDWSVLRTIDIYAPPSLELHMRQITGAEITVLDHFPFFVDALASPNTQAPIGYHLSITSNEIYETVDNIGNEQIVNAGEVIYSKYFDTSGRLIATVMADSVNLENNVEYTLTCTVSLDSGLTAESSLIFTVAWTEEEYEPNAEIGIDEDTLAAYIRPYCEGEEGNLLSNVRLSVHRREFDGSFTEIAKNILNTSNTYVTDPHPALDFARYRIVATDLNTGAVSYCDLPGYPVQEKSVVIQWDEDWSSFETNVEDSLEQPPWSGSMLKLPYNIDVSDNHDPDVELIEYIGREHPVSYYGTQVGSTSSWNVEIVKEDTETLYALRRLAKYMGDVYVREPSGSGYWANIKVSFNQKHLSLTIPVTLDVVRVEGGM